MDPWASLGVLSGSYDLVVYREEDDCSFGPDVPLALHEWDAVSEEFLPSRTDSEEFEIDVVHRGETLAFELGEGIVYARWDASAERIEAVDRVGAEGVTQYVDGFAVITTDPITQSVQIRGSGDWLFFDEYYAIGEQCSGRTTWQAERTGPRPSAALSDLQIVLRWPASSRADLDLSIIPADPMDMDISLRSRQVNFADSRARCYSLHSAGRAIADPADSQHDLSGFVAGLDETVLPYHEEVIRCRAAPWGRWQFNITNWSAVEAVDFDLEVFWGPHVNTTRRGERSFGVHPGTVGPLDRVYTNFELTPPWEGEDDGNTGITITGGPPDPYEAVVVRPYGPPVAWGFLAWNKAAFEGYAYEEFLRELGL